MKKNIKTEPSLFFYGKLIEKKYEIITDKIKNPLKFAFLSDLHDCFHGKDQKNILAYIERFNPDAVLLGGDIADERENGSHTDSANLRHDGTIALLSALRKFKCYYVLGNHEFKTFNVVKILDIFKTFDVTILDNQWAYIGSDRQKINIFGLTDPLGGKQKFMEALLGLQANKNFDDFSILLTHRPELIRFYLSNGNQQNKKGGYNFDLILTGHAHGGQWRIPCLLNGLFAPDQGLFPKYAGGIYRFNDTQMIVGRGLATASTRFIPRIFNPPEVVLIYILPRK